MKRKKIFVCPKCESDQLETLHLKQVYVNANTGDVVREEWVQDYLDEPLWRCKKCGDIDGPVVVIATVDETGKMIAIEEKPEKLSDRSLIAFGDLTVFEYDLRSFIDRTMNKEFGDNWFQRLPSDIVSSVRRRREKDLRPLKEVHYVQFPDYMKIIVEKENWKKAFRSFFKDQERTKFLLKEITRIRNSLYHAREISDSDSQLLHLYIKDMLDCIRPEGPTS